MQKKMNKMFIPRKKRVMPPKRKIVPIRPQSMRKGPQGYPRGTQGVPAFRKPVGFRTHGHVTVNQAKSPLMRVGPSYGAPGYQRPVSPPFPRRYSSTSPNSSLQSPIAHEIVKTARTPSPPPRIFRIREADLEKEKREAELYEKNRVEMEKQKEDMESLIGLQTLKEMYGLVTDSQREFDEHLQELLVHDETLSNDKDADLGDFSKVFEPPDEFFQYLVGRKEVKETNKRYIKDYGIKYLRENLHLTRRIKPSIVDEGCGCMEQCDENCLNFLMKIECHNCKLGAKCENNHFQSRRWRKTEVRDCGPKGNGLFAMEDISAGDFVIEYVGEVLNMKQLNDRREKNTRHCYFFNIGNDITIDASVKGCESRFINHSCDPNLQPQKWNVCGENRIGFFAVKDIKKDTELCFDYSFENFTEMEQKCYCGAANCRGTITSKEAAAGKKKMFLNLDVQPKRKKVKREKMERARNWNHVKKSFKDPRFYNQSFKKGFILRRNVQAGIIKRYYHMHDEKVLRRVAKRKRDEEQAERKRQKTE